MKHFYVFVIVSSLYALKLPAFLMLYRCQLHGSLFDNHSYAKNLSLRRSRAFSFWARMILLSIIIDSYVRNDEINLIPPTRNLSTYFVSVINQCTVQTPLNFCSNRLKNILTANEKPTSMR